jgi:Mg/Co/Ni transporter MgtE
MSKVSPLTIELIEKRPQTAVAVLADMDPSDVGDFFEALPTRYAVALASKISAWSAAALLCEITSVSGAAILSELDYQATASIMRVLPDANRTQLLSALPKTLSRDLKSTLTFPADTVGAKMSAKIVIMTADQTVGAAFADLRKVKRTKTGVAFVVDDARKLLGVVTAADLFRFSNERRLGDVMETAITPLSARARLTSVKAMPDWDIYADLPVVNRQKILIGALSRRAFRQAIIETPSKSDEVPSHSILSAVAGAFFGSSAGLARVLVGLETPSETISGDPS